MAPLLGAILGRRGRRFIGGRSRCRVLFARSAAPAPFAAAPALADRRFLGGGFASRRGKLGSLVGFLFFRLGLGGARARVLLRPFGAPSAGLAPALGRAFASGRALRYHACGRPSGARHGSLGTDRLGPFLALITRRRRPQTIEPEVGRNEAVIGHDKDLEIVTRLDVREHGALLVEDIKRHVGRDREGKMGAALADAFFLDRPEHMQRHRFGRADVPGPVAVGAALGARLEQARTQPLARQLEQAKGADLADLDAGAVGLHGFLQALFDHVLVPRARHVDEVDDDEPGKIPEPQLARDFLRRLEVGLVRRLLDVAFPGGAPRVDVNGDQRLRGVDDDVAARLQMNHRAVHGIQLAFHLVAVEQRDRRVAGALDLLGVTRQQHAHEVLGRTVALLALDQHFVDVLGVEVADRALDQIGFLVHERRGDGLERQFPHAVPEPEQILGVTLRFGLAALDGDGAQDDRHPLGQAELVEDAFEPLAVGRIGDLARNAALAGGVGHQNAVPAGKGEVGGERRALVAPFLLDHLDEQDLAALDNLLDSVALPGPPFAPALGLLDFHIIVPADDLVVALLEANAGRVVFSVDVGKSRLLV